MFAVRPFYVGCIIQYPPVQSFQQTKEKEDGVSKKIEAAMISVSLCLLKILMMVKVVCLNEHVCTI